MGLRGIGAKPIKKSAAKAKFKIHVTGKSRAARVISFIQSLPVTSGILAGHRFKLGPWQKKIIKAIYREEKGRRVVRQALESFPRKNGKTTFTSALALCHLCGPEAEPRGEVYSAANERTQAAIIFREMKAMVLATNLKDRVIIRDFAKQLEDSETGSIYQALSADVETKHGFSASFWAYDELGQAPNRRLYDVLSSSGGGRLEPLGIIISTQSADSNSIMSELVDYGEDLNSGVHVDPSFHATIYSAPLDADPWAKKTWLACNPAIASGFRSLEEIQIAAAQAQRIPAREASFRLLYLNQRVNVDARFIAMAEWDACAGPAIDPESLNGRICYAGLDLATTTDIAALVLDFPPITGDPVHRLLSFFWIPQDGMMEKARKYKVPYDVWQKQEFVQATPGNRIDYGAIMFRLGLCKSKYDMRILAYDRWGSDKIVTDLCDRFGFTIKEEEFIHGGKPLLRRFGQGFVDMSPPTKEFLNMILGREIAHGNNPVLRWMANNTITEMDAAGNIKPSKRKSIAKIDGIVASIMAVGTAVKFGSAVTGSVYDERAKSGEESIVRAV